MRIAIVGSRDCGDFPVEGILKHIPDACTQIISGGANGIDELARLAAARREISFLCITPDYAAYGRRAPIIRNTEIVKSADLVLAFWDFISRGTANAIVQCIELGTAVKVIGLKDR